MWWQKRWPVVPFKKISRLPYTRKCGTARKLKQYVSRKIRADLNEQAEQAE